MKPTTSSLQPMGYASPGLRLLAFIIDCLVFTPINVITDYNHTTWKIFPIAVLSAVIWVLYKTIMEWKFGATIGKMLTRIRVVDERMQFPSFDQAMIRFAPFFAVSLSMLLFYFELFNIPEFQDAHTPEEFIEIYATIPPQTVFIALTFFLVSVSNIFLDPKSQALHDKLSHTYCIKVSPTTSNESFDDSLPSEFADKI